MIEIIGSNKGDERELKWRELPKNVRQIGETREKRKIYMEDYVVTYLGRLSRPGQAYARGAILFGDLYRTEEGTAVFVSGAMEAQNLELDMDDTIFNDAIWRDLLEKGEQYFPGQKVMGWFLSRMGFSVEMNQKIINTHLKNFPGNHRILYMIDSLEKEDAIYICENNQMIRQKGYYIYYEKNSPMQEYMLSGKSLKKERVEQESQKTQMRRDKKIVDGYRKRNHYSKKTKKQDMQIRITRIASVLLILVMCAYIYQQMDERHWIDGTLKEYVVETMGNVVSGEKESQVEEEIWNGDEEAGAQTEETLADGESETGDGSVVSEMQTGSTSVVENATDEIQSTASETTEETFAAEETKKPMYYIVEKGDTLASISRKMYLTDKYTKQIAWANDLVNEDEIYEGQKILIPSIQ